MYNTIFILRLDQFFYSIPFIPCKTMCYDKYGCSWCDFLINRCPVRRLKKVKRGSFSDFTIDLQTTGNKTPEIVLKDSLNVGCHFKYGYFSYFRAIEARVRRAKISDRWVYVIAPQYQTNLRRTGNDNVNIFGTIRESGTIWRRPVKFITGAVGYPKIWSS